MKKMVKGYFSLEAAFILPMVLSILLFIVYLLFFQYNRCLMEQDMGILALRGAVMQVEDNTDRVQRLRQMTEEMSYEKYLAWEMGEVNLTAGKGVVIVERLGQMKVPFRKEGDVWWSATTSYKNQVISPVTFIRTYRRFIEGENRAGTQEGGS